MTPVGAIRRRRVAVVEDNADNRLLLHAILSEHYEILEFDTGPSALEGLPANIPDAVLLDISLPGMDGIEVLASLRADERLNAVPVVALTAHAMSGDREKYLGAGFNDYVAKPIVDDSILLAAIERLLR